MLLISMVATQAAVGRVWALLPMAAGKIGPNVVFCMPNRTKCIPLVSIVAPHLRAAAESLCRRLSRRRRSSRGRRIGCRRRRSSAPQRALLPWARTGRAAACSHSTHMTSAVHVPPPPPNKKKKIKQRIEKIPRKHQNNTKENCEDAQKEVPVGASIGHRYGAPAAWPPGNDKRLIEEVEAVELAYTMARHQHDGMTQPAWVKSTSGMQQITHVSVAPLPNAEGCRCWPDVRLGA
jgi:hypothetical protein